MRAWITILIIVCWEKPVWNLLTTLDAIHTTYQKLTTLECATCNDSTRRKNQCDLSNATCDKFSFDQVFKFSRAQLAFTDMLETALEEQQSPLCQNPCAKLKIFMGIPAIFRPTKPNKYTWFKLWLIWHYSNMSSLFMLLMLASTKISRSYIRIYFKKNIRVKRALVSYGVVSLLAELGGYSGLLLGFSLFQLSQMLGSWIRRHWCK